MLKALASWSLLLALSLALGSATMPRAMAENLPVSAERYGQACTKTGGAFTRNLSNSGIGTVYCLWAAARDRTECKVGSNQVNVCTIRCSSAACLGANPDKSRPVWPLNGGPKNAAPVDGIPQPDTLAPAN